jgi:hypothetical protein
VTAAVITVGAVEVSNRVATVASNEGVEAPSRVVASTPPVAQPDASEAEPVEVAMLVKASAEPPVVVPVLPPAETGEGSAATEPLTEEPAVTDPATEAAPSDGLEGEIVDVPVELPPEPSGPEIPVETDPGTVGQVIDKPAPPTPPVAQPDTPLPSTPTPAPPVEVAPQVIGQ